MPQKQKNLYQNAGVSINNAEKLIKQITPFVRKTKKKNTGDIGGFGGTYDLKSLKYTHPILVAATDGVGTKLKIALETGNHKHIGQDLVAMCVNDILTQGAKPLFFLDYFATAKLNLNIAKNVIKSIANACQKTDCALIGGETAEMPDLYKPNDYDIAGFTVGIVEKNKILPKKNIKKGDIIIALPSSGAHANGFSLIRKIVTDHNLSYQNPAPFNPKKTLGNALLTPTTLYTKPILKLLQTQAKHVKAIAHITGGGLTDNIPRILPDNHAALIRLETLKPNPVFKWIKHSANVPDQEMLHIFNCGVGMICVIHKNALRDCADILAEEKMKILQIGEIITHKGKPKTLYQGHIKW